MGSNASPRFILNPGGEPWGLRYVALLLGTIWVCLGVLGPALADPKASYHLTKRPKLASSTQWYCMCSRRLAFSERSSCSQHWYSSGSPGISLGSSTLTVLSHLSTCWRKVPAVHAQGLKLASAVQAS